MSNPVVLIINPLNSLLKNQITKSLSTLESISYISIDSSNIDYAQINIRPSLIFILLDKCNGANISISNLLELSQTFPSTPVICFIDIKTQCNHCLDCQQLAWGFFKSPISTQDLQFILSWYIKKVKSVDSKSIEYDLKKYSLPEFFVGESSSAVELKQKIKKIAPLDVTVLLQGETGTGKELSAKLIHSFSNRSEGPFVAVNCGAIPNELFENELFGHKKGAYTHADTTERGLIHSAHTGTLFLDEIESLPTSSQAKLLRFIEEKKYKPLGQTSSISSDVRIIAAANKDLIGLVKQNKFRDDLFYRLSVVNIFISPLRDRESDIPILANFFVNRFSKLYSKEIKGIRPDAMMHLTYYHWPGNIREMENLLKEAVIFSKNNWIEVDILDFLKDRKKKSFTLGSFHIAQKQKNEEFEKNYLKTVLSVFHGNISKASAFAKKDRRGFYRLIKKYNIKLSIYRSKK